jgi:hypothetical protein
MRDACIVVQVYTYASLHTHLSSELSELSELSATTADDDQDMQCSSQTVTRYIHTYLHTHIPSCIVMHCIICSFTAFRSLTIDPVSTSYLFFAYQFPRRCARTRRSTTVKDHSVAVAVSQCPSAPPRNYTVQSHAMSCLGTQQSSMCLLVLPPGNSTGIYTSSLEARCLEYA